MATSKASLWLRWIGANSLAELVGLGATFAADLLGSAAGILLLSASGLIEGIVVGLLRFVRRG